ncbi:hypothetical protein Clacol_002438 [Clathrus columnatus]|uniref:Zf-C3HC-domain-containing protein n=1 Tax=Clathrus columnatus TaxID=1419009 RepID=A0AAV5A670_9AGAM|nr:hypothetical protein Clacol_002438 [Clathrus columnatus]
MYQRKADEAFDALDDALRTRDTRPSPTKRATSVSFYSSLAKHGITTKSTVKPSVSTPTLSALLTRARSKRDIIRPPLHLQPSKMPSVAPEYSPSSTEAFLERLSTFNVSTYPSKPQPIDAVAAAMAGWINEGGRNRLLCSICQVGWIVGGRDGMGKEAAETLVEKQAAHLITNHKEGCPWRTRQCDPLVYRIPLQSPQKMAKQVKERADELDSLVEGVTVRHPLSTTQLNSFVQAVTAVVSKPPAGDSDNDTEKQTNNEQAQTVKIPSATSLLTALFGWTLVPSPAPIVRKPSAVSLAHIRNQSLSRANSVIRSTPPSRDVTPAPQGPTSTPPVTPSHSHPQVPFDFASSSSPRTPLLGVRTPTTKDATLQCKMCQRRIGLWAFTAATSDSPDSPFTPNGGTGLPQRQLDLVREHRSYCPYVVKSTPLSTLPLYGITPSQQQQQQQQPYVNTVNAPFNLPRTNTSLSETASSSSSANFQKPTLLRSASIFSMGRNMSSRHHGRSQSVPPALQDLPLVEGWRAVYNTVLRYGISERATTMTNIVHSTDVVSRSRESPPQPPLQHMTGTTTAFVDEDEDDAMNGVNKIVEDVKRHGGKRILAYVRNLLG